MGNKIIKKKRKINKQRKNEEMFGPKWPIHLQPSIADLMVVIMIAGYITCCILIQTLTPSQPYPLPASLPRLPPGAPLSPSLVPSTSLSIWI